MTTAHYKHGQTALALLSLGILASSFYFQYVQGLLPCPLCLMQRLCVFLLFLLASAGIFANFKRARLIVISQFAVALAGLYFASRQLWLQSLPSSDVPACMPQLDVLMRYFPWHDILHALFWGAGDCAEVSWTWLGLSMPAWVALYFLFMLLSAVLIFWTLRKNDFSSE
jgi:disulfide bond formation protein DsbB